jgi:predicted RNase H-like HicB family nuclease
MEATSDTPQIEAEVQRVLALPYRRELIPNSNGTWFAHVPEFPGCVTEGDDPADAIASLTDAMAQWVRGRLESDDSVPAPAGDPKYSGKFLVRVARWMHRALVERADAEGISLNQYVVAALSYSLGLSGGRKRNPLTVEASAGATDDVANSLAAAGMRMSTP